MRRPLLMLFLLVLAAPRPWLQAAPSRYVARLQNGAFVEGAVLSDWHAADVVAKLDNQVILDPGNPFRWLVDRGQSPPSPPDSFVEFVTGDRLPGVVIDFRNGEGDVYSPLPAHLLVRYEGTSPGNLERRPEVLRVDVRFVKRIVWQRTTEPAEPRTALLREGNRIRFRSARFGAGSVSLLGDSGARRVLFSEIAELDLAPADFWPLYWDEIARLAPDGQRRLMQLDATNGLVATTSLDRYLPRAIGDVRDINRWIHGVQPAWCFDVIWVPQNLVWMRRSFAPHEVPLTRVPIKRAEQRSPLGDPTYRHGINRNASGGLLRAATREAGWGLGVHAFAELEWELPPIARHVRSEFAIDATMQDGGCVMARVLNASAGNAPLYQGPVIVGSSSVVDTGPLGLSGPADALRRVVFQVDPVLTNRPAGADPLDIRDHANWLDPLVELDPAGLKQQLDARSARAFPAWQGWDMTAEAGGQTKVVNFFAEALNNRGEHYQAIGITGAAGKLTRAVPLAVNDRWLVVDAVRTLPAGAPCKVSVRVGEGMPTEFELPNYDKSRTDFRPIVLSLAEAQAKKLPMTMIEIRQLPTPEGTPIWWRCLAIVAQHPLYYRLLEDDETILAQQARAGAAILGAERDVAEKHFGQCSFRIAAGKSAQVKAGGKIAIRERPQLGEYRFLRFVVRKTGGGGMRIHMHHADEGIRSSIYEAGANQPADLTVKRLNNQPLAKDWLVVTRDLYGDFGNIDLEGMTFEVLEGEFAWIDHIYLARGQNDFNLIK